jgi:DNA-binding transcriptional LysR family regulator
MVLAQVPSPIARASIVDGRLQELLTRFAITRLGVFLYHPGKRQVLPKLRAFIDHVKTQGADAPRLGRIAPRSRKLRDR